MGQHDKGRNSDRWTFLMNLAYSTPAHRRQARMPCRRRRPKRPAGSYWRRIRPRDRAVCSLGAGLRGSGFRSACAWSIVASTKPPWRATGRPVSAWARSISSSPMPTILSAIVSRKAARVANGSLRAECRLADVGTGGRIGCALGALHTSGRNAATLRATGTERSIAALVGLRALPCITLVGLQQLLRCRGQ
jgi:hypothetical protein